ncbi:50S ribosomal protein L15 [Candidatus Walczuchella monophlebidarum]|uniref:Large ribosomal subunit protein uL15 n=1 Tax=Candidatus Walczuchella monophlebidarum TaxID=1415657 RepID=A0A068DQ75_9FLAO|nr:50S ribosomal protein L15 [Candidatus Walczuchella monophlebidarum]AID37362.1 ribosomal protein L15 [Candidatus Walczuchella monophlebidarum]
MKFVKNCKRLGRGQASGKGGTSTRGHKGAKSRSGNSTKFGFEGGQMPLQRRIPKFGFKNIHRKCYVGINIDVLQNLVDKGKIKTEVNPIILQKLGLVSKNKLVKILGRGKLTSQINFSALKFSKSALKAIQKVGGKIF